MVKFWVKTKGGCVVFWLRRASKAGLMGPLAAAGLPPAIGAITGLMALLYQEDG